VIVPTEQKEGPVSEPRIAPRDPEEVVGEVRTIFDTYLAERGNVPNMFRTVAIRPEHLTTMIAHFRTVMNEGDVPPLLKELISVRVSALNRCRY
jgi:alkylhydroperoxidase family enzyme